MHMPDLSDEELDALFRQGAEGYPEELNLGAWARMEQKLDEARIQQLANRKVARLFAAEIGIVAVLLLIWGGYREYVPGNDAPAAAVAAAPHQGATETSGQRVTSAHKSTVRPAAPGSMGAASPATASAEPQTASAAADAMTSETPAAEVAAVSPTAAAPRRKARPVLPLAAGQAEPNAPASTEVGAGSAARPASTRRQRHASTAPLLIAAGRSKSAAAKAAHSAAPTSETDTAVRQTTTHSATNQTTAANTATGGNASAGGTLHNQTADAPAGTTASAVTPAGVGADANGSVKAGAELGAATGTPQPATGTVATTAAASNGTTNELSQVEPTATGAAFSTTSLTADALQPVSTKLLTDALAALPTPLPADSIVRRRPRPFVPSRLFITGLYAPELSTVRGAGAQRVGHSAGIQIEYLLLPRLRLDVGLLSSMKYYRAHAEDYTSPRPPMYPIDHVDATCRITDIPVNLRYDAWQGVRYRAYGSVGLSSLLMRDEQYHYSYYGTTYTRNWQVKKGSKHLFSVLNLSAGLERQLTPRWSLQAEPYVKLPLGGVGAGKVRLSSGGVFFGLKYGL